MRARTFTLLALVTVLTSAVAEAKGPDTFPLSAVKRGQKGYGVTTFQGMTPERFEFEVIGVISNFLPKLDIILVKSDDQKVQVSGFWQGMSGSPLYIDGKLVCAFSYGFKFNKLPIGGCTPIEYMKQEGFQKPRRAQYETRPARGGRASAQRIVQKQHVPSLQDWLEIVPNGSVDMLMRRFDEKTRLDSRGSWLVSPPGWSNPAAARSTREEGLVPAAIPLSMSGFTSPAFSEVERLFANYPVAPMRAGGTGNPTGGPNAFQMGGSIAVHLIRGDMSVAGTGTVSYIDGNSILAFGHPMFQVGELYAPVSTAEVHTVIPSAMSAFVVASPNQEIGSLIHDRKSTISADTSLRSRMIPVDVTIRQKGAETGVFKTEILNDQFFMSTLANMAAFNAASHYMGDRDHVTARIKSRVVIRKHGNLEFVDYLYSKGGSLGLVSSARGLRALMPLLMNPFEPVDIERVDLDIEGDYAANFGDIVALRVPSRELTPGKDSFVYVDMTTYDGQRITEKVPFEVPRRLAGSVVRLEVTAGDATQLDAAPPRNINEFIDMLRKLLPGDTFAVTLYTADEGVAIDGKLIHDVPSSVADRLKYSTRTESETTTVYQPLYRSLSKSSRVINGGQSLLVRIADENQ